MKVTVSTTYDIIGLVKGYEDYGLTKCGKIINLKRCKIIKKTFKYKPKALLLVLICLKTQKGLLKLNH